MTRAPQDSLDELPWPEPVQPRVSVSRAICQHCTKDLRPRRGPSAGVRLAVSLLLATAVVVVVGVLSSGSHPTREVRRLAVMGAVGWALVQAAVLAWGFARPPGRRPSRRARTVLAMAVPLLFLGYLGVTSSSVLPLSEFVQGHLGGAVGCSVHAFLYGSMAAAGILALWRATDPFTPALSGALAGLVGGVTGAVAVGVSCPSGEAWHLWLGHGSVLVVLALAGWVVGRKWLAP